VANAPVPVPGEAVEGQLTAPSGVRILVVDDDPHVCRSIANAMSRAGFHVLTAEDGAPALELAAHALPDIALVDFNMPTPGLTVVERLKATHGPAIHIAVLSGEDDEETRAACFDAGADEVLSKPMNMAELRRRMLAAARMQRAYVESRLARERADRLLAYGVEAAAMLAHDLNNGLSVALTNMSYLHGALRLGELESQALTATLSALRRMSGLVANFVDIARFEDAAVKPQTAPTNVRALLRDVIEVHAATPASSVRFEIDCEPALSGTFDPALIERVLHNLIGNAVRYCFVGGVVRLAARTWDPLTPSSLELTVYNSGPPVAESVRDHLFDKYAKGSNGKRGFGLYFCRLACEAHGGTISYRDTEGGPVFCVRLPGRS
jgi:two-component system, sensor histidine kinase and response regulator